MGSLEEGEGKRGREGGDDCCVGVVGVCCEVGALGYTGSGCSQAFFRALLLYFCCILRDLCSAAVCVGVVWLLFDTLIYAGSYLTLRCSWGTCVATSRISVRPPDTAQWYS